MCDTCIMFNMVKDLMNKQADIEIKKRCKENKKE